MNRRSFITTLASALCAAQATELVSQPSQVPLKNLVRSSKMLVGAQALRHDIETKQPLAQFITENCNLMTPGMELTWGIVRQFQGSFNFRDADWMVNFGGEHGLAIHGHTLCWDAGNPDWLETMLNKYNAEHLLVEHIHAVVGRYKGKIRSWDVVNEPIAIWQERPDGLYKGPWLTALGPEYIDIAFHATRDADPNALRVLNVHHVEQNEGKYTACDKTLDLIEALLKRNVPVQAIGFESHLDAKLSLGGAGFQSFVDKIKGFGLQVLVTELDVNDTSLPADEGTRDKTVAKLYESYLDAVYSNVTPVSTIFWTPCDCADWLDAMSKDMPSLRRSDSLSHRPGLLDASLKPKSLALAAVRRALANVGRG